MPDLFLSPSTQEFNPYNGGGNEEYYANLIADAMEPYLNASGITYTRNDSQGTVSNSIALSNSDSYKFHLAIHSNAAPPALAGQIRGADAYYYRDSQRSQNYAEIIANNFKLVYPVPSLVAAVPTTTLAELRRTQAPSVLIEIAYHDNEEDAAWIRENVGEIARNLSLSVADILDVPFIEPVG